MSTLDHVTITAAAIEPAAAFYDAVLAAVGLHRLAELVDEEEDGAAVEAIGWGADEPVLWLVRGTVPTTGLHVRLRAGVRDDVDRFHRAALDAGGSTHSAPRRWAIYRTGEFNAIVRDPAGNLVEAVAPE